MEIICIVHLLIVVVNALHVCEGKAATFPWKLPANSVGVGFAVIYQKRIPLRNIILKKPSENRTISYDDRVIVDNSRTLTNTISTDTGSYTFLTSPTDSDDWVIELCVHNNYGK